jgi:hypothetical protein
MLEERSSSMAQTYRLIFLQSPFKVTIFGCWPGVITGYTERCIYGLLKAIPAGFTMDKEQQRERILRL